METFTSTLEPASHIDRAEEPLARAELVAWRNLLTVLTEPAALVERGLSEADSLQRAVKRQPRKAAVAGTGVSALLATLLLRLRGAEVVTLGRVPQPLFHPSRVKGLTDWKHVWMSAALAKTQLVEETGARYASTSDVSFEGVTQRLGPFDLIVVGEAESSPMRSRARGLAEHGVLVDLSLGNNTIEIWAACPTPSFLVKHRVSFRADADDHAHTERAMRNLALADALYPGWLARLLANSAETSQHEGLMSAYLES